MNTIGGEFRSGRQRRETSAQQGVWSSPELMSAGQRLRARREAPGVPVEAIARKTKMPRRTVELLEADDYEAVGAEFYVRGFLKLYAEHLGMRAPAVIEAYEAHLAAAQAAAPSELPNYFQAGTEPTRSLSPAQIFLLVVCAATLLVFMLSVQKQRGGRVVAKRPAISAPGTPATAHQPPAAHDGLEPSRADAVGN